MGLLHNIVEGRDKDRLTRSAELRPTQRVDAWMLSTGEDVPSNDPATLARLLPVRFGEPTKEHRDQLTKTEKLAHHFPAVMRSWAQWLEIDPKPARAIAARINEIRTLWRTTLLEVCPDTVNPDRVATNLATLNVVWEALKAHPDLGSFARELEPVFLEGLELAGAEAAEATAEGLGARWPPGPRLSTQFRNSLAGASASG